MSTKPDPDGLSVTVNPDDPTQFDIAIPILIVAPIDHRRGPVRDIREAMHPAPGVLLMGAEEVADENGYLDGYPPTESPPAFAPLFTQPAETFTTEDGSIRFTREPIAGALLVGCMADTPIDIGESGRAAVQSVVNEVAAKVMPGHEAPTVVWAQQSSDQGALERWKAHAEETGFDATSPPPLLFEGPEERARVHLVAPHVATLPDGSRVNLPAGTVLREGEDTGAPSVRTMLSELGHSPEPGPQPGPIACAACGTHDGLAGWYRRPSDGARTCRGCAPDGSGYYQ